VKLEPAVEKRLAWSALALLLATAVLAVWLAPAERTLGQAIKYVYVHVALTRAGIWGFYLAGALGLVLAATAHAGLHRRAQIVAWAAYGLFLAGGVASLFAQRASWGGVPWSEPRNLTTLNVLALGIILLIVASWLPQARLRGLLYAALAGYAAWVIPRTPLALHPADPVGATGSAAIRGAFLGFTTLSLLLGVWLVYYVARFHDRPQG
jgi:hypothetical protein